MEHAFTAATRFGKYLVLLFGSEKPKIVLPLSHKLSKKKRGSTGEKSRCTHLDDDY
jgi:hypothetical protein